MVLKSMGDTQLQCTSGNASRINSLHSVLAYLPRVSHAVRASDRYVRARAELDSRMDTQEVHLDNSVGVYKDKSAVVVATAPIRVVRFEYNEDHRVSPQCVVDVRDVRAVEFTVWWLQAVGVSSLRLEGVDHLTALGSRRVWNALLSTKRLANRRLPLTRVLQKLTCMRSSPAQNDDLLDNLSFLQLCKSLETVQIVHHTLVSLDGLEKLKVLKHLSLVQTQVRDRAAGLEGLRALEHLVELSVKVTFLQDLKPFSQCVRLQILDLRNCCALRSLEGVARMRGLKSLCLAYTGVRDLRPLSECVCLRILDLCKCTAVCSLEGLERMKALVELYLADTDVRDLSPLSRCLLLEKLNVRCCAKLDSLHGIEGLRKLRELHASSTGVRDLAALAECRGLRKLILNNCSELRSLRGLEKLEQLKVLFLRGTKVQDLKPLDRCVQLRELDLVRCAELHTLAGLDHLKRVQVTLSEDMHSRVATNDTHISYVVAP
ncbi:leucine-rich repeat protein (LRRP) [Strigomonas culicis]|uniref:Leucine-rich repeat protein (LRRP) n=1 Tax=Strigomonas culicis TaxID=28005 RepID=S9UNU0_9TRYP|nr:leucine-rich repeat protein (LRRP) [Strigomonas culicis]|eukprot:EPY16346.1 leucine-rich repeat protein (LRRP) [Strigomonas culicis]